jgi:hypothetical protein
MELPYIFPSDFHSHGLLVVSHVILLVARSVKHVLLFLGVSFVRRPVDFFFSVAAEMDDFVLHLSSTTDAESVSVPLFMHLTGQVTTAFLGNLKFVSRRQPLASFSNFIHYFHFFVFAD